MAIKFQNPINQLIRDFNHGLLKETTISSSNWTQLTNLKELLHAFYQPTILLQGLNYPTLSLVLPILKNIYTTLLDLKQLYKDDITLGEEDGVSFILIYIIYLYIYNINN